MYRANRKCAIPRAAYKNPSTAPPVSLANLLLDPANPRTGMLGLKKVDFMSPRVFGPIHNVNDTAPCGQVGRSQTPSSITVGHRGFATCVTTFATAGGHPFGRLQRRYYPRHDPRVRLSLTSPPRPTSSNTYGARSSPTPITCIYGASEADW